ncbi:MAG TPA: NAD(P)-dependent oxidoreductase [Candidatus Aquicultor sp.]|jgi:UDP-glucose 4-epimerase
MNILVTGAGGDIGLRIVAILLRQGHHVKVLATTTKEARSIRYPGVEIFVGNVSDARSIKGIAIDTDVVFHLADALFVADPEETLRQINYEGTINIAEECTASHVKRFIFPSIPQVLGPHKTPMPPLEPEDTVTQPSSFYALYKRLCEQHLLILGEQGKLPVTILRLGTIYGPHTQLIKMLTPRIARRSYRIPGTGNTLINPVHIDDVVHAILLALGTTRASGQIYNVADNMPVTYKEFIYELAGLIGAPHPKSTSVSLCRSVAAFVEAWARITKTAPSVTNDTLTLGMSSFAADTVKTKADLGFTPLYPTIYDGLPTCFAPGKERRPGKVA